jgi:chromosome segregation ATPase
MNPSDNSSHEQRLQRLEEATEKISEIFVGFQTVLDLCDGKISNLKKQVEILTQQNKILQDSMSEVRKGYHDVCVKYDEHLETLEKLLKGKPEQ